MCVMRLMVCVYRQYNSGKYSIIQETTFTRTTFVLARDIPAPTSNSSNNTNNSNSNHNSNNINNHNNRNDNNSNITYVVVKLFLI